MKAGRSSAPTASSHLFLLLNLSLLLLIGITTSCGSSIPSAPTLSGNTSVTVLLSSTANDQVTNFAAQLQNLTLTSRSGKTVNLLSSHQSAEFTHINGGIEPQRPFLFRRMSTLRPRLRSMRQDSSVLPNFQVKDSELPTIQLSIKIPR